MALAKVLVDFAKDNPALTVKAAVVAGTQMLDADGVKALSTMPGLPELRAKLLGLLQAPADAARAAARHAGDADGARAEGAPGQARGQVALIRTESRTKAS